MATRSTAPGVPPAKAGAHHQKKDRLLTLHGAQVLEYSETGFYQPTCKGAELRVLPATGEIRLTTVGVPEGAHLDLSLEHAQRLHTELGKQLAQAATVQRELQAQRKRNNDKPAGR